MTQHKNCPQPGNDQGQQSLSGLLDVPELLRVRILPAQLARALGVSKQSVSRWVRDGWVTLAADGRLDPVVAIGQLLRRCDPGRLRARWLRQAVTDVQALREAAAMADQRVAEVEARLGAELAEARSIIAHLEKWIADGERADGFFMHLLVGAADDLRASPTETWMAILDDLYNTALDAAAAQPDPTVAAETDGWLADLELPPADGADLAAMNADLDGLDRAATASLDGLREAHNPEGGGGA